MKQATSLYELRQYLGSSAFWPMISNSVDFVTVYAPEYRIVSTELSSKIPFEIITY
jgi:hypothetical protein